MPALPAHLFPAPAPALAGGLAAAEGMDRGVAAMVLLKKRREFGVFRAVDVDWMTQQSSKCARIDEYDGNISAHHACLAACVWLCVCVCVCARACSRAHCFLCTLSKLRTCLLMCACMHRLMNTGLRIRDACPLQSWRIFPCLDDLHAFCRYCCIVGHFAMLVLLFVCASSTVCGIVFLRAQRHVLSIDADP